MSLMISMRMLVQGGGRGREWKSPLGFHPWQRAFAFFLDKWCFFFLTKAAETSESFVVRELHNPNSLGKFILEDLCTVFERDKKSIVTVYEEIRS